MRLLNIFGDTMMGQRGGESGGGSDGLREVTTGLDVGLHL